MEIKKIKRFKIIYLIIAAFLCITFLFIMNEKESVNAKQSNTQVKNLYKYLDDSNKIRKINIIAHRGVYLNETENSINAINNSIKNKVKFAEIDVQETKDGKVVLMHDKNLKRLTGLDGDVNQFTFNQLEALRLGMPAKNKRLERIPTLESVINKARGRIRLIIEIKPYGNTDELTAKVVNIIEKSNFVNQCMIHSASYNILLGVRRLNPMIKIGYIAGWHRKDLTSLKVDFYSVEQGLITNDLVREIHKEHRTIYSWTVDKPNNMDDMLKLNVDGIITNRPNVLINAGKKIKL